jgi:hypothetical protein
MSTLTPLMTPDNIIPRPEMIRSTNANPINGFTGLMTPSPRSPLEIPPAMLQEHEKIWLATAEIESVARRLW